MRPIFKRILAIDKRRSDAIRDPNEAANQIASREPEIGRLRERSRGLSSRDDVAAAVEGVLPGCPREGCDA